MACRHRVKVCGPECWDEEMWLVQADAEFSIKKGLTQYVSPLIYGAAYQI